MAPFPSWLRSHRRGLIRTVLILVAIELLSAAQGSDLRSKGATAPALRPVYEAVREHAKFLDIDRVMSEEMETLATDILAGRFNSLSGIALDGLGGEA